MRKPLLLSKKAFSVYLLLMGIILAVLTVMFLNSETANLILPPKKKSTATASDSIKIKQQAEEVHNSTVNRICRKYGNIQFITKDWQFIVDDNGAFAGVEDIIYTSVPVPDSIKGIAGLDKNFTYMDRIKAADALKENLNSSEQRALLHFLHKRTSEDELEPIKLNAVKNQVAMALMRQIPANHEFPLHLVAMYFERANLDLTWRDYCIQFLGQCYKQIDTAEHRQAVRQTLFTALKDKKDIAAPAIIAIDGLSKFPGFVRSEIALEAYKLAADDDSAYIVKIPALQIAAKYKHPKAVELARKLLLKSPRSQSSKLKNSRTSPTPVILKMSAIATIGANGDSKDIEILTIYRKSADIRLRNAAKTALKKLM